MVALLALLTVLTQIGGVVLLLSLVLQKHMFKKRRKAIIKTALLFAVLYLISTFLLVPNISGFAGRKALPITSNSNLIPVSLTNYLLNRHYVKKELYDVLVDISVKMNQVHPKTKVLYLDANFPFFDGFPLLPHLSHNDGRKIDLAFYYSNTNGVNLDGKTPTLTGYGYFIEPSPGEMDYCEICKSKGSWQYDFTGKLTFVDKSKYQLNEELTKDLLRIIVSEKRIKKVFIEPHLKTRLGFSNNTKIRFHGCHAVRHDDHFHLQL